MCCSFFEMGAIHPDSLRIHQDELLLFYPATPRGLPLRQLLMQFLRKL